LLVAPHGQIEDFRRLAAVAGAFGFLRAFGRFLGLAFFPDLGFDGATFARRAPAWAFFVGFAAAFATGCAVSVCSAIDIIFSPLAVITASRHRSLRWVRNARQFGGSRKATEWRCKFVGVARCQLMPGFEEKLGRKQEAVVLALLSAKTVEEAARLA
jgi:hypothetical protein